MKERYIERFGLSYECLSDNSAALMAILREECGRRGVMCDPGQIFAYLADFPRRASVEERQLRMF